LSLGDGAAVVFGHAGGGFSVMGGRTLLCHSCRYQVRKDFPYCLRCGTQRKKARVDQFDAPQLRQPGSNGASVATVAREPFTIGRSSGNDLKLDHPSVSREHARIIREAGSYYLEDLGSLNGIRVDNGLGPQDAERIRGGKARLHDGSVVFVGDVALIFEQPRTAAIGSKTMVRPAGMTMLAPARELVSPADVIADEHAPAEPLSATPRKRSGWALKQIPDDRGRLEWALSNTRTGAYLSLDERQVFIWNQIDGRATTRDLLFAYLEEYGELALPRIEQALKMFASVDLVAGLPGQRRTEELSFWRRVSRATLNALLRMEISVKGLDGLIERGYRRFGWWFFTRPAIALLALVIPAGLVAFWFDRDKYKLLDTAGAGPWGGAIVLVVFFTACTLHEMAHAMAVKSYGRRVNRGGFMLMMGMPFAFVDTSDMWLGSRWSRVVVALSGPLVTAEIAGGLAVAAYCTHSAITGAILFQIAFALYLNTLYNFNPLMPLDGYMALSDAMRFPRLREESRAYFTRGLWRDLRRRKLPTLKQWGMTLYGLCAILGTYGFIALGILAWNGRIGKFVHKSVPEPWAHIIIVAGIGVVLFPVWYGYFKALTRLLRRLGDKRQRRVRQAPAKA
jgi:putative peptide zinc metalloprotease protein